MLVDQCDDDLHFLDEVHNVTPYKLTEFYRRWARVEKERQGARGSCLRSRLMR